MKQITELAFQDSIDAIKNETEVMFKSGVWNPYEKVDTAYAIKRIEKSGYGADVFYNEEENMYYVSKPADSDMW